MKVREISIKCLNENEFSSFGDVIWPNPRKMIKINNGTTKRYHDLARVRAYGTNADVVVNIFRGHTSSLPVEIRMMERHPYGSQVFYPINSNSSFLSVVAEDNKGIPSAPHAFLAERGIGINYHPNTWHHPLLVINRDTDFLVIDRTGTETNLEEYFYEESWLINSL